MPDIDLDAIEQRLAEGRIVNVVAQRALLAEVRRLRAMEQRVREYARYVARPFADGVADREGEYIASKLLAALDDPTKGGPQ